MSKEASRTWRINVAAIIRDAAGHILLGRKSLRSRYLHFPQGGVKQGESLQQAVLREIHEEVGISPESCTILAEFPGLRYTYRKKNKKSKFWLGQQQTYFLISVPGCTPAINCSASTEFCSALWQSQEQFSIEQIVPFKRTAVARAMTHFFPSESPSTPPVDSLTPHSLYLFRPGGSDALSLSGAVPLFAGGKDEAHLHLSSLPLLRPPCLRRLLVILIGLESTGLRKAIRSIACHTADPSRLHICTARERYELCPQATYPLQGELAVLSVGEHARLLKEALRADDENLSERTQPITSLEKSLQSQGINLLKIALQVSEKTQLRRLREKGKKASLLPWSRQQRIFHDFLCATSSTARPWYLLPTEHGWYRDYLIVSLIRHFLTTEND